MRKLRLAILVVVLGVLALLTSPPAWAQTGSGLAGTVTDASGGVLPGVAVVATSPALIEQSRETVTDGQGNYRIVSLQPGTYSVTFTLPGFSIFVREEIELPVGFTATIDAEMTVGNLEETVTVSGESPVVDIQNVRTQNVLSSEVLDTLPTAKTVGGFVALTLGVSGLSHPVADVGGSAGETFLGFGVHGSATGDTRTMIGGMNMNYTNTLARRNNVNQIGVAETSLETRGNNAEQEVGGVMIHIVPKEGGNIFNFTFNGSWGGPALQGTNLSADHIARGLTEVGGVKKIYDTGFGLGGPIIRDKVWFYTAHRFWGAANFHPGLFFNQDPTAFLFVPDRSRQKFGTYDLKDFQGRVTWQVSPNNKVAGLATWQVNCVCYKLSGGVPIFRAPEASVDTRYGLSRPEPTMQNYSWTYTATNRLLIEGGALYLHDVSVTEPTEVWVPGTIAKQEATTGFYWGSRLQSLAGGGNDYGTADYKRGNGRFSVSYVTGAHSFKTGFTLRTVNNTITTDDIILANPFSYRLVNGVPDRITQWAAPQIVSYYETMLGLYAQDQWTIDRMTVNAGLRLDFVNGTGDAITNPGGPFRAAADYPGRSDIPNWKDVSPRLGVAYDLFGTGKTAVKFNVGRYLANENASTTSGNTPANAVAQSATRSWNDANGNQMPDCVLTQNTANGECGDVSNFNLGSSRVTRVYDPDYLEGWGKRAYNWQVTASVQHELMPNVALNVGYYRTSFGGFTVDDNRAVGPTDYEPYSILVPTDSRLPNSGQVLSGLFDITPEARRRPRDTFRTLLENLGGTRSDVYNGFDFGINTRLGGGRMLQGGISFGRTAVDNCFVVDSPQQARPGFCKAESPWWDQRGQVKIAGVYPLPGDLSVSATYQNTATFGIGSTATYLANDATIVSTLGRPLAGSSARIDLIPCIGSRCGSVAQRFDDRINQLDVRAIKSFNVGGARVKGIVDVYNLFNSGAVVQQNGSFGSAWLRPLVLLDARMAKFGVQVDW